MTQVIRPVAHLSLTGFTNFVTCLLKVKEAKAKGFKKVYAKDIEGKVQRLATHHLNDEAETEVDKTETVEGEASNDNNVGTLNYRSASVLWMWAH